MVTNIVTKLQTHTTENDTSPAVFGRSKRKKIRKKRKTRTYKTCSESITRQGRCVVAEKRR